MALGGGGGTRPLKVGLVLGGGGSVGMAYHAGALAALEQDLGWDPRTADVIVGTSAGAIIGALLRRDVPASDLAAMAVGATTRHTPTSISTAGTGTKDLPPLRMRTLLRPPRLPSLRFVAAGLRRPWRIDPVALLASVMADGEIDLAVHAAANAAALGDAWPEAPLWICAVEQGEQRRTVFGVDRVPPLDSAVMASCAIPGYISPVLIDGRRYLDGGVRSPTNADVLERCDLDLVVAISPMSGRQLGRIGPTALIRRHAHRKVARELGLLGRKGARTFLFEPSRDTARLMGIDFMAEDHITDLVSVAFLDAGAQLRDPGAQSLVARLGTRHRAHAAE